ncbi:MAG: hypothetical protein Q3959_03655 [Limosilactobacillus sp.]|nr:hypothetical protein [Limosilactobacillus sp.]
MVNVKTILTELLLIAIYVVLSHLIKRFVRTNKLQVVGWGFTTFLFFGMGFYNLGWYWSAYPLAVWMIWAIILVFIQLTHNHEFIYKRYWPPFWQYSMIMSVVVFVASFFAGLLPVI